MVYVAINEKKANGKALLKLLRGIDVPIGANLTKSKCASVEFSLNCDFNKIFKIGRNKSWKSFLVFFVVRKQIE